MARKPFVIIDAEILSSSIWSEEAHVRLVWLTLLILCDTEGYVGASVPGIAKAAGVTLEQAIAAMEKLQSTDPFSRTQANEGRRLEKAERGWQVLNFKEHLERLSAERQKTRDRMRRYRERLRAKKDGYVTVPTGNREQGPEKRDETSTEATPVAPRLETALDRLDTATTLGKAVAGEAWNKELADDFRAVYGGPPPASLFAQVKPVAKSYGWARTRPALKALMSETPLEYLNVPKLLAVWVENGGPPTKAVKGTGVGDRSMDAIRKVMQRHGAKP